MMGVQIEFDLLDLNIKVSTNVSDLLKELQGDGVASSVNGLSLCVQVPPIDAGPWRAYHTVEEPARKSSSVPDVGTTAWHPAGTVDCCELIVWRTSMVPATPGRGVGVVGAFTVQTIPSLPGVGFPRLNAIMMSGVPVG